MGRTKSLPGMPSAEPPEDLVELGKKYKAVQRQRMRALAKEIEIKELIITKMHDLERKVFADEEENIKFELVPGKERLKVSVPSEDEAEAED